jgi:hypothetical protein
MEKRKKKMTEAAINEEFEVAAKYRNKIKQL